MSSVTRPDSDEPSSPDVDPHAEDPARIEGRTRWLLLGGVATAVFVVDLLTKWWAVVALVDDRDIDIVWTLRFKLVHNTGSAFSLAEGRGVFLSVAALGAVAILLVTGRRTGRLWSLVAIGLIIGGALGNLADRAFRAGEGFMGGGVVDFIDLQWWPVFNIADMGVVIGAGLLIVTTGNAESRSAR